ncbi:hypothetical protein COT97_03965 [Candidatus Falkowbacteria bacterium CG10_big_fil_rev_8_21_14_0_10_39_11]|uniref:Uncharacterized protein n=1 Tax=Candidatus Falkowbacteria bacterium CG10_big_fil_rev_8_21_14_0_10_39_11 TaxID=1974565 RepID=A0A2H0V6G2_9BACT|nr:MAG: hypothetical protein COT97_03965 [Candidatus Falkowbacteria bacterium CG10_big_fil_rev_8_21_14_0_10_39_11]
MASVFSQYESKSTDRNQSNLLTMLLALKFGRGGTADILAMGVATNRTRFALLYRQMSKDSLALAAAEAARSRLPIVWYNHDDTKLSLPNVFFSKLTPEELDAVLQEAITEYNRVAGSETSGLPEWLERLMDEIVNFQNLRTQKEVVGVN